MIFIPPSYCPSPFVGHVNVPVVHTNRKRQRDFLDKRDFLIPDLVPAVYDLSHDNTESGRGGDCEKCTTRAERLDVLRNRVGKLEEELSNARAVADRDWRVQRAKLDKAQSRAVEEEARRVELQGVTNEFINYLQALAQATEKADHSTSRNLARDAQKRVCKYLTTRK